MIRPWIEWNPAIDEYAVCFGDKSCWGLFDGDGFCFVGVLWRKSHQADSKFWTLGLVIWNIGFGLWFDEGEV